VSVIHIAWRIGLHAQLACIWEATARKPGNVHRYQDFDDLSYLDFLTGAAALASVMPEAPRQRVGATVFEAVRRTQHVKHGNINLGIVLLLAPLAKAALAPDLRSRVEEVLAELDLEDACLVFEAIRRARPGGLGEVTEQDVRSEPTRALREVMALAAERDLVARQYSNGFAEVFDDGVPALTEGLMRTGKLEPAIVLAQLHLMARHPDSLIARKRGPAEAAESSRRAARVLDAGWPYGGEGRAALRDFDRWLRAEGHARNPGTTADLVAACLFVMLCQGTLLGPEPAGWTDEALFREK
jgi:triphosphoribosyl-dephospho-CoA synthase